MDSSYKVTQKVQVTFDFVPAKSKLDLYKERVGKHEEESLRRAIQKGYRIIRIASFGCGVDSIGGLVAFGRDYDEIIFDDTGGEKPETYAYLEYLQKTLGWNIVVLKSKYGNIYDYYYKKKIYPTMFARDCTGKFKIDPQNKYLRTKYGKKAHFIIDLFIDNDEPERMFTSKYRYITLRYPLIDAKMGRDDCVAAIKNAGMPIPIKSGCFFCPYTPPEVWRRMKNGSEEQREMYAKAKKLEDNSIMRDKRKYPLIRLKGKNDTSMSCHCFNPNIDTKANELELDKLWKKGYSM